MLRIRGTVLPERVRRAFALDGEVLREDRWRCPIGAGPFVGEAEGPRRQEMVPMAQYLINVLNDSAELATPAEMAAIDVFDEGMRASGNWVFAGGLGSPAAATVVDARDAGPVLTDGPYLESKEWVVGFWIVEAADLDEALRLAGQGSRACNRRVELRPFL